MALSHEKDAKQPKRMILKDWHDSHFTCAVPACLHGSTFFRAVNVTWPTGKSASNSGRFQAVMLDFQHLPLDLFPAMYQTLHATTFRYGLNL